MLELVTIGTSLLKETCNFEAELRKFVEVFNLYNTNIDNMK